MGLTPTLLISAFLQPVVDAVIRKGPQSVTEHLWLSHAAGSVLGQAAKQMIGLTLKANLAPIRLKQERSSEGRARICCIMVRVHYVGRRVPGTVLALYIPL